jgi:hypothetical protein
MTTSQTPVLGPAAAEAQAGLVHRWVAQPAAALGVHRTEPTYLTHLRNRASPRGNAQTGRGHSDEHPRHRYLRNLLRAPDNIVQLIDHSLERGFRTANNAIYSGYLINAIRTGYVSTAPYSSGSSRRNLRATEAKAFHANESR